MHTAQRSGPWLPGDGLHPARARLILCVMTQPIESFYGEADIAGSGGAPERLEPLASLPLQEQLDMLVRLVRRTLPRLETAQRRALMRELTRAVGAEAPAHTGGEP